MSSRTIFLAIDCDEEAFVRNPFTPGLDITVIADDIQDELLELRHDSSARGMFLEKSLAQFWCSLQESYPQILASDVYRASQRVCVYLPMRDEINTLPILESMFKDGKDCFIPHYKNSTMIMVKLNSWEEYDKLPVNNWGIKQPAEFDLSQDANCSGGLDLILMPGLAFTAQGVRLGRGKGYYDKYLQSCKDVGKLPHTVALAFLQQLQENVPSGENDISVNSIVFPTQDEIREELQNEK